MIYLVVNLQKDYMIKDLIVVELASVLAGPLVGSFFAELGARVIKIENKKSGGDITRQWKLPEENVNQTHGAYFSSANTGKESIFLDLTTPNDYSELKNIISTADIVISNYQKKTAEKLKIDYHAIFEMKKDVIFAQLNAYSYDDPRPGFDLVMQAESGFISMNGTKDGELVKMPVALIDVIAGHQMKEAILLSLLERDKNTSQLIMVSLYKSAISALANQASNFLMANHVPKPIGLEHPNIAPYGDFIVTKDEKMLIFSVGSDYQFEKLGKTLKLAEDLRYTFRHNSQRVEKRSLLMKYLQEICGKMKYEQLSILLSDSKVPFCKVNNLKEVFTDKYAQEMVITETKDGIENKKVRNIAFSISQMDQNLN